MGWTVGPSEMHMGPGDHTAIMEREKKRTKKKQTLFKATKYARK